MRCACDALAVAGDIAPAASACLAAGDGAMQARVRGAIDADVNWTNAQMSCEGGMRPDRKGIRVTLAGPMPHCRRQMRDFALCSAIALEDTAPGTAQALPTNLTVILEGQQQLFATRGDDKCAVEQFEVTPLLAAMPPPAMAAAPATRPCPGLLHRAGIRPAWHAARAGVDL